MKTFDIKKLSDDKVCLTRNSLDGVYTELVFTPHQFNDLSLPEWLIPSELYKSLRAQGLYIKTIRYGKDTTHYVMKLGHDGIGVHYHFESALWNPSLEISKLTCHNAKIIPVKDYPKVLVDRDCKLIIDASRSKYQLSRENLAMLVKIDEALLECLSGRSEYFKAGLVDRLNSPGHLNDLNLTVKKLTGKIIATLEVTLSDGVYDFILDVYNDSMSLTASGDIHPIYSSEPFNAYEVFKMRDKKTDLANKLNRQLFGSEPLDKQVDQFLKDYNFTCPSLEVKKPKDFDYEVVARPDLPIMRDLTANLSIQFKNSSQSAIGSEFQLNYVKVLGNKIELSTTESIVVLDTILKPTLKQRLVGLFQTSEAPVVSKKIDDFLLSNQEAKFIYADEHETIFCIGGQYCRRYFK